jgi:hypothetical protein
MAIIQKNNARLEFNTVALLQAAPKTSFVDDQIVYIKGILASSDSGYGNFQYSASSSATDDGATVIEPTGSGNGRFLRVFGKAVSVKDFGAVGDGTTDDTAAINAAAAEAVLSSKKVRFPGNKYKFTSNIVIPAGVTFEGGAYDHNVTSATATVLLKSFDGDGITIGHNSQLINVSVERDPAQVTDTGDGVYQIGSRSLVRNVGSHSHGGNGFRIGSKATGDNTNFWRAQGVYGTANGGNGLYVHHDSTDPTLPNVNAGILESGDFRGNTGSGVVIGQSVDCQYYGLGCQLNTTDGIRLNQYAVGHYFSYPYVEANTSGQIVIDSGANRNIFWGFRGSENADAVTDNGTSNLNLGRTSQITDNPFIIRGRLAFEDLLINDDSIAGYFSFAQNASTGDMDLTVAGTGSERYFNSHQLKIDSGAPLKQFLASSATVNFGTVAANSTVDANITVTGVTLALAAKYVIIPSSGIALPAGLAWGGGYVSADNQITVRVQNCTGAGVAMNQQTRVLVMNVAE